MNISVIIPAYNCQSTIERCLTSLVNQDVYEIVVVDDGSVDHTADIILSCKNKDPRIRYIKKENGGVSSARNLGIKYARGEYIMFIDSDDEIKSELIQRMSAATVDNQLVVGGVELHQDAGISVIVHKGRCRAMDVIKNYGTKIPGLLLNGPCCKFYRKDIIDSYQIRFDSNISLGEDTLFVFEYLKYCENVFFVDYAGYVYYQIGTNSLMTKYRPDAYFSAKSVYQRLMIITRDICGGICPENMKLAYKNVLMVYIRKMIFNRNKVSREIIIKTIQNYIDDEVVQSCLRNQNKSVYSKLVDWLTEKKRGMCLELLLDVHVKFRGV